MQTFVPYADFAWSSQVLDDRRLGKQRVETFQILRALTWPTYAWKNHPATRMWRGFVPALVAYGLANCDEWVRRGHGDTVRESLLDFTGGAAPDVEQLREEGRVPPWLGLPALHVSHRSALVRKDPGHYRRYFPDVPDDLPYLWPDAAFPRWPVRRGAREGVLPLETALAELGFEAARSGQAEAVAALVEGRDVLLCSAPGVGGSSTALLAGLVLPGRTLYVTPDPAEPFDDGPPEAPPAGVAAAAEPASREALTARAPSPEDAAAMADEVAADPEFTFLSPSRLGRPVPDVSLVVVDRAAELAPDAATRVRAAVGEGGPPVLAVTGALDAAGRAALADRIGLRQPVWAGGGWDVPEVALAVSTFPGEAARRRALGDLLGDGPAVLVTATRRRAEQVAAHLERAGIAAQPFAPGMRAGRLEAAVGAFRAKRLRALVVAADMPDLGRARLGQLVTVDPPADLSAYHRQLVALQGRATAASLLLLDSEVDATEPALQAYVTTDGCRRQALLDHFGEPVAAPCGRCDNDR